MPWLTTSDQPDQSSKSQELPATPVDALTAFRSHRVALIAISVLALLLYGRVLKDLASDWWNEPDYNYAFLVPVFVAYVLWHDRNRYRAIPYAPSNWGAGLIFLAIVLLAVGTLAADAFISRISLWVLVTGMTLYLCGSGMLRALAFPLAYLALVIPLPLLLYNQLTFPLQLMASRIAATLIELTGVPVFREGNILSVPHYSAEVAVACSGIRSLLSLAAFSAAYGYLVESRVLVRAGLVVLAIPLAVLANAARITLTSLVGYKFGPPWAEGFVHLLSGWMVFVFSLALFLVLYSFISRVGKFQPHKTLHA